MMRVAENDLSSFFKGKFIDSVSKHMRDKMLNEEKNIKDALASIRSYEISNSYSPEEREEQITSLKKSLRKFEDRKAFYYKKIQSLKNIDVSIIEKSLKKNPKYDGLLIDSKGRLNLYTKMLKDGIRNIGRFRICIFQEQTGTPNMKVVNLDYHARGSYDHWAVSSLRPCMGEWAIDFERNLWSGDISEFFNTFIMYIELSPAVNTYFRTKKEWYDERTKRSESTANKYKIEDVDGLPSSEDDSDEYEHDDDDDEEENIF